MHPDRTRPYYGWVIALTLALTETISWGILYYAFSVFITPMEAELGWSRAELTGGFSLLLLVAGGMAFPVGTWIDRHGARLLMTAGSAAACLLVIAWSAVTTLPVFYAIWIGLGMCAAAVLYDPAFAVVARWFLRQRSAALVVITIAAGLASTIFLPLSDALLTAFGWRVAVLILGLFLGIMTIPLHLLILRRRPEDLGLLPDGEAQGTGAAPRAAGGMPFRRAVSGSAFWLLTLGFALFYLAGAALRVHFIPFLIGGGFDSSTAAYATGAIGIMQVGGRVVFAPLERRFSARTMILMIFALQAVAQAVLLGGHSPALIAGFIVLFGAAQGAGTLVRPAILASLYGAANFGRIASVMTIFLTLASTAAPLIASLLYDRAGSYQPVVWLVVAISLAATGVAALANRAIRRAAPDTGSLIASVVE